MAAQQGNFIASNTAQEVVSKIEILTLAERIFIIGVLLRLLLSNNLLDQFMPYVSAGGFFGAKVHPGTFLITFAFLLSRQKVFHNLDFGPLRRWSWVLLVTLFYAALVIILRFGLSSTAYLIDTYIAALFAGLFLARSGLGVARHTFYLVVGMVLLNSLIAIFERIFLIHILPDPDFQFGFFRSYAIFGHPLLNAVITGLVGLFVLANRSVGRWSVLYFLSALVAILAFGARAALVFFIAAGLFSEITRLIRRIGHKQAILMDLVSVPVIILTTFAVATVFLFQTTFGERFLAMSDLTDSSTAARAYVFSIYESLSSQNFWFGISPAYKRELIDQNPFFSIIENFWVDMSLSFGMFLFAIFSVVFLIYLSTVARSKYIYGLSTLAFFLVVTSTNNALSVKTPALLIFVCTLMAARRVAAGSPWQIRRS